MDTYCFKCNHNLSCDFNDSGHINYDGWIKISYQETKDKTNTVYLCEECKGYYYNDMQVAHRRWFYYNMYFDDDDE